MHCYRCFLIFLLLTIPFYGQAQKLNFRNFSVNEGLAQSEIYSICEDVRGNLWLGTSGGGLIRFDGYSFVSFREENGLPSNFVRAILQTRDGNLWIGTDKGICVYNGKEFDLLNHPAGPGRRPIKSLAEDKSGNIWVGTSGAGLFKIRNGRFERFTHTSGLPDNTINCLLVSENELWIGTNDGTARYKNHQFTRFNSEDGLVAGNIRDMARDKSGKVWFASGTSGVSCFHAGSFTNYNDLSGLASNKVFSVFSDHKGRIWFGTANGLTCFCNGVFTTYTENNGLGSNVVLCIREDAANDLWFGTSGGGVSRLDNARFTHFMENDKMGRQVFSLIQTLNGKMLFATSGGGLTFFDGKNYFLLKGTEDFGYTKVKSLYYDRDSTLWIGTLADGTYRFDNHGFARFGLTDSLIGTSINGFAQDSSGNMWITSPDSGICVYTPGGISEVFTKNHGLTGNNVYAIYADRKGNVWVGTNQGLNKLTVNMGDSLTWGTSVFNEENGLENTSVGCITGDEAGNVYLGTGGGGIFILHGNRFIHLTQKDGLASQNIYSLVLDRQQRLWAGSEVGVDKITLGDNFEVMECRHFGKAEGFQGVEVYRNAGFTDRQGRVWFGTVNGASVYNPAEDIPYKIPPPVHITGIKLFFDNIEKTKYADTSSRWYPIPHELILPYNQNSLTFSFAGIYLRNPESVKYRWMLEGLDNEWSPPLTRHEVTYSSLPPGYYTFKVIACNEYNVWSKEPVTFSFRIRPPFYKRWWFILLTVIMLLGGIGYYFHTRLEKVKEKNRIDRERLEMEMSMIELEQEASRLQMNPHFIFNALNSIQGFIATNDALQARKYLNMFARLMRLILENAREKFIPLRKEVEILENYLELERLCKNEKFSYFISIEDKIDREIELPPMMIQPFVENAIVHGIKNKEGNGKVEINFRMAGNILICEVKDDGVGRKKAGEIKARFNTGHKSTAIQVTRRRLEQLHIQTGEKAGFEIEDLMNEENLETGTRVIISIPVES